MEPRMDFVGLLSDSDALQLLLFACPDGVVVADPADRVILYAGASEAIFGFAPIDVLNRPVVRLFGDRAGYHHFRERLAAEGRVVNMEITAAREGGSAFAAAVSAVVLCDRYGAELGFAMYVRDHTKVRAIEEALRDNNQRLNELVRTLNHVAQHDQLTGMLYRGSAIEAAEAMADGGEAAFGVALFDLDGFKRVNDNYGHLVGDEVLAALAAVLRQTARKGDILGRFGGEEFIAFLPAASLEAARSFAERVRLAIAQTRIPLPEGDSIAVTVSAGVSAIPDSAPDLHTAIRIADDRLLAAKRAGRNRVVSQDEEEVSAA